MFPYLGDRNTGYISKSTVFGMALGERGLPTWSKYMTKLFGDSLSPGSILILFPGFTFYQLQFWVFLVVFFFF